MAENELSANVTFTYSMANRWLGIRFDLSILILTVFASVFCCFMRSMFNPALLVFCFQIITDVAN